jgi:hypothetical protein
MEKKNALLIGAVVLIAIAALAFLYMQKSKLDDGAANGTPLSWSETPAVGSSTDSEAERIITAKHAYKAGKHTVAGEMEVPTPCNILDAHATPSSDGKKVFIEFASSVKTGDACIQVITPVRFKVTAVGAADAVWSATYNGQPVKLNLIEAGPKEDLDNFELYIKG